MTPRRRGLVFSATPHPDESFSGYLIRLTESNHYETPSWILQLGELGSFARSESLAFEDGQDFSYLAHLTGVDTSELIALTYRRQGRKDNKFCNCLIFGLPVPRPAIHLNPAKVCPGCLREHGYARRIWDLSVVTTCPFHKCLLIDECPNCHRRLPFMRNRISICKCQYDWRECSLTPVEETEMELTRRVHSLCNLPGGFNTPEDGDRLGPLQLKDLLSVVSLVTSQYYLVHYQQRKRYVDTLGRWLKGAIKNTDVHALLCQTMSVFRDWPNNYFSFLEWRRQNLSSTRFIAGVKKDFGQFGSALRLRLKPAVFNFMREGFDEYLTGKWDGGYASCIWRLKRRAYKDKGFVSKQEACKSLGVGTETINQLVATGKLKGVITQQGRSRMMLIETITVDELKAERNDLLDRKQTAKRLGINTIQTEALVRANLLTERDSFDGRSTAFYSVKEIDGLIARATSFAPKAPRTTSEETVDFAQALYTLACHHDIGVPELVQSILDGKIRPCGTKAKSGFTGLTFYRRDLDEYQNGIFRMRYPNTLSTYEAAESLKTSPRVIRFLIKNNLLSSQRVRWHLRISVKAISDFSAQYVLAEELASSVERSIEYLIKILKMERIKPVTGTQCDRAQNCVYLKSDIDKIDLQTVVFTRGLRLGSQRAETTLLNVTDAARFLQTDEQTILQMVSGEILRPRKRDGGPSQGQHYFAGRYLRRFDGKVAQYCGVVSMNVAGRMFRMNPCTVKKKYVATGQLRIIKIVGDWRPYFRRKDVEELIESEENFLSPAEVRAFLNISHSQSFRMVKAGILKPARGPSVDGSATNLFLRREVENVHKTRKRFKLKRMNEGGSSRFGIPAGPQRSPVLETIAPRVNQLIANAKAEGRRLSGGIVHRQLLRDGYEVGINSVYVYLRTAGLSTDTDRKLSRRAA
jgi:TniQ protein